MEYYDDKARAKYLCIMEQIIAKHCSTESYKNNPYRYPVCYKKNGKSYKTKGNVVANVEYDSIQTMHYDFGAHRLDIGKALLEIMDLIEEEAEMSPFAYYEDGND